MSNETFAIPGDYLHDDPELQFADGRRVVPAYLAAMMANIKTERYTYQRAVELANSGMVGQFVERVRSRIISDHFEERHGRG